MGPRLISQITAFGVTLDDPFRRRVAYFRIRQKFQIYHAHQASDTQKLSQKPAIAIPK